MSRVDEILAAIDTGLQTAGDFAYGDDWPHTCWRCGNTAEDLCDKCRTTLLDETQPDYTTVLIHLDIGPFRAALDRLMESFNRLSPELRARVAQIANHTRSNSE